MKGRINLTASAALPTGPRKAPDRVRIWRAGANPGDYGACNLTPRAAAMVAAAYEARGNLAPIDIEHGTNPKANPNYDPNRPPPGGGYYAVKVVETPAGPEIWADPVRWSDYARSEIESGSRGYVSPDWDMTTDTREPIRLNKISLVLEPGTFGINLLASASAARGSSMNEIEQLRAAYAALLAMVNSTDADVKANATALCAKLKEQASTLGIDLDASPDAVIDAPVVADASTALPPPAPKAEVPGAARAVAARPLTSEDVASIFRQENVKRELLALAATNREGMTPALANVLASKPLTEVRSIVGALPLRTVAAIASASAAATTAPGKVPPAQLEATASASAVDHVNGAEVNDLTPEEARDVVSMRKQFGLSVEAVTASRVACAKGEGGVLTVARLREMKKTALAADAAKVAASK